MGNIRRLLTIQRPNGGSARVVLPRTMNVRTLRPAPEGAGEMTEQGLGEFRQRETVARARVRHLNLKCGSDAVGMAESNRMMPSYEACSAVANSPNSALFKSDTAQNDMPLWIQ